MSGQSNVPIVGNATLGDLIGGLRPLEHLAFAGNETTPVALEKCQFIWTDYTPNARIWLEAQEPPRPVVKRGEMDNLSPSYADFVIIISPRRIIVARPIQQVGPIDLNESHGHLVECGGEIKEQMGKICEVAKKMLVWDDPSDTILFRVYTPLQEDISNEYRIDDMADLKTPDTIDLNRYMFPKRVQEYRKIFEDHFGNFNGHTKKTFHLSGYIPFRGAIKLTYGTRIVVADLQTVKDQSLATQYKRSPYKYQEEDHEELKVGYPLVLTSAHQNRRHDPPQMIARLYRLSERMAVESTTMQPSSQGQTWF